MSALSSIDRLNRQTMKSSVNVYADFSQLYLQEKKALESVIEDIKNKRILDIGVGGGRTTAALIDISTDYTGVDYMQEMVDSCRDRFPGVRFDWADARSMPQFVDGSFDLIMFSANGICMVDHAGRMAILHEIRRLLAPGGVFVFTTYNRNNAEHDRLFVFPDFSLTKNPIKLFVRSSRFVFRTFYGVLNRLRFKKMEVVTAEYSIINDRCHDYQTMLYYLTLDEQKRQLQQCGFKNGSTVFDGDGSQVDFDNDKLGDSLLFVVRG